MLHLVGSSILLYILQSLSREQNVEGLFFFSRQFSSRHIHNIFGNNYDVPQEGGCYWQTRAHRGSWIYSRASRVSVRQRPSAPLGGTPLFRGHWKINLYFRFFLSNVIYMKIYPLLYQFLDYPDFIPWLPWLHSLTTLTEVFPCFSSVVRQMPGLNSQSRGTDLISSELLSFLLCLSLCYAIVFMLFCYYVVRLLCCSVIICVVLCIDCVYCTTATGC